MVSPQLTGVQYCAIGIRGRRGSAASARGRSRCAVEVRVRKEKTIDREQRVREVGVPYNIQSPVNFHMIQESGVETDSAERETEEEDKKKKGDYRTRGIALSRSYRTDVPKLACYIRNNECSSS